MEHSIQNVVTELKEIHQAESALPLRNEACRSRFLLHPHRTTKVFLFLHGFTAGPYQFEPLGKALHEAGYNVLVPLQPGHGRAGEWRRGNPPPLPTQVETYQCFVLEWMQRAEALGDEVIVGGLSSGANLAAWLGLEYPERVGRSLLYAPFLKGQNPLFDWLIGILPFYYEWFNKDAPGNFGYKGFRIPALRPFLELAKPIMQKAKTSPSAPTLIVSSEADPATDASRHRELFQAIATRQPKSWYYCFDKTLDIGHRMMTRMEDNPYEEKLIALTQAYVESNLTGSQLQDLTQWMQAEASEAIAPPPCTEIPASLKSFLEWDLADRHTGFLPLPKES